MKSQEKNQVLKSIYLSAEKVIFLLLKVCAAPFVKKNLNMVIFWAVDVTQEKVENVLKRVSFYIPDIKMKFIKKRTAKACLEVAFSGMPVLLLGNIHVFSAFLDKTLIRQHRGVANVDYELNPGDGCAWHCVLDYLKGDTLGVDIEHGKIRFIERIRCLEKLHYAKSYIFGTGPSLDKAMNRNWSDGYRIVCNTIVRDPELWRHLEPHFIVAGDAIYHFGHTKFAQSFREDLRRRLKESDTLFLYPAMFHHLVKKEFEQFRDRLIPVPIGKHQNIASGLTREYSLPNLGNVLPLLLLPLACTLSKRICLFGFDGRAPDDRLFWKNSNKHTYIEHLPDLQKAHPAFFSHNIPKKDPFKYVKTYHGDILEKKLKDAELAGWEFIMLHPSFTAVLQKRFEQPTTIE